MKYISKTEYLLWRACPKNAWLRIHKPDLYYATELTEFEQSIMDAGIEVELVARNLFPDGVLITGGSREDARTNTRTALESGNRTLFQPFFEHEQLLAMADVLQYDDHKREYSIYEVKASTEIKDEYLYDLAFQMVLLRQLGINATRALLLVCNSAAAPCPFHLLTSAPSRLMAHEPSALLLSVLWRAFTHSAVLMSPAHAARASALAGSVGLRGMHPSRQRKTCCQSVCFALRPPALPALASALPLRLFFSASAKVKEKNQSSKEARRIIMRMRNNSTLNTSTKSATDGKSFSNNLVILTGNLGADAAFFGANDSAASFRMATKSKFGEKEYIEWHSVVAFRELAKEAVEKCTKGRFIKVYGYLHHSKNGSDAAVQFKTEVVATRIKYLDRKK